MHGKRLNPRKADLQRWREVFAEKLREWGVDAEATRQASRGVTRNYEPLWRLKAREDGRLLTTRPDRKSSPRALASRSQAIEAWRHIAGALAMSPDPKDRYLAEAIGRFAREQATGRTYREIPVGRKRGVPDPNIRPGPENDFEHQR